MATLYTTDTACVSALRLYSSRWPSRALITIANMVCKATHAAERLFPNEDSFFYYNEDGSSGGLLEAIASGKKVPDGGAYGEVIRLRSLPTSELGEGFKAARAIVRKTVVRKVKRKKSASKRKAAISRADGRTIPLPLTKKEAAQQHRIGALIFQRPAAEKKAGRLTKRPAERSGPALREPSPPSLGSSGQGTPTKAIVEGVVNSPSFTTAPSEEQAARLVSALKSSTGGSGGGPGTLALNR